MAFFWRSANAGGMSEMVSTSGRCNPIQEQTRVRGEALDVAPLALGVYSVEDQAGLTRTRNPGYYSEASQRQIEVEVLQIVGASPPDDD